MMKKKGEVPRTEAVAHAQREEAGMGKPACSTRSVSYSRGHARQANRPRQQEKKHPRTRTHHRITTQDDTHGAPMK